MKSTILTVTKGRETIVEVATCIRAQTRGAKWLIVADSIKAHESIRGREDATINLVELPEGAQRTPYTIGSYVWDSIQTENTLFFDDDNLMLPNHIAMLEEALEQFDLAFTRRVFIDNNFRVIGFENPESELVDTNCIGVKTELLRKIRPLVKESTPFHDRHFQAAAFALGARICPLNMYTVMYVTNESVVRQLANWHLPFVSESVFNGTMKITDWCGK